MIPLNFNENLKVLLNKQNLRQADLCRMTGIQTSLMSEYIKGKNSPTIGNAIAIADALHISLDTLVSNKITENIPSNTKLALDIFEKLSPEFQSYSILQMKELLNLQKKIFSN